MSDIIPTAPQTLPSAPAPVAVGLKLSTLRYNGQAGVGMGAYAEKVDASGNVVQSHTIDLTPAQFAIADTAEIPGTDDGTGKPIKFTKFILGCVLTNLGMTPA